MGMGAFSLTNREVEGKERVQVFSPWTHQNTSFQNIFWKDERSTFIGICFVFLSFYLLFEGSFMVIILN